MGSQENFKNAEAWATPGNSDLIGPGHNLGIESFNSFQDGFSM